MDNIIKRLDKLIIVQLIVAFVFIVSAILYSDVTKYLGLNRYSMGVVVFLFMSISLLYIYIQTKSTSIELKAEHDGIFLKKENELLISNQALKEQLYIDALTHLENRRALERDISGMSQPKLIILDIDSFKGINEYYGYEAGNFLLCEISSILKDFAKKEDMNLYRIGADEFALLEENLLDMDRYEELADSLSNIFKSKMLIPPGQEEEIEINSTLGFSLDDENILEKASLALSEAKKKQIPYLCYFQKIDHKKEYMEQIRWSEFIKKAIKDNRIIPFYQPILDSDKNIVKYECLVRILDENEEVIPPGLFLEISKKVKRYAEIEKILIEKSFAAIKDNDAIISINLLARDMSDSNVSNFVIEKLNEYKVHNRVIFEILEDENIDNLDRVKSFMQKIKTMGCKIAIDDFGTGYSNFSYLIQLRPDYLKIDGSLIKNIDKDENSLAIVSSIIAFAKKLEIKTIAEYVHNEEIFNVCLKLGVDEFQGFYLGEPTPRLRQ